MFNNFFRPVIFKSDNSSLSGDTLLAFNYANTTLAHDEIVS